MLDPNPRETIPPTLGQPRAIFDHLKHDLVLWLNHHSLEELPDALEYYLVNPMSDLDTNLTDLDLLDQSGVKVAINLKVTMTLHTLLDWAKRFLATNGGLHILGLYYPSLETP